MKTVLVLALALPLALAAVRGEAASLDPLFDSLAKTEDRETARTIAERVRAIWEKPEDPQARRALQDGITALEAQEPEAALDYLDTAVEHAPQHAQTHFRRAQARFATQDTYGAMEDLATAVKLEPRHFDALTMAGTLYLMQGNDARAAEAFERALSVHPHHRTAKAQLATLQGPRGDGSL